MITEKELQISNKSYTNKDFLDIYPEILSIANKLSERWKPQSSNESDPGIVLLKLLGFIGDKLNYNVDKNVLECFLPSATQMSSVRNLCELGGYTPRYYQSAVTEVSVMYQGSKLASGDSFELKAFETMFTDENNTKTYVLTTPIVVSGSNLTLPGRAIEGSLETLTVRGVDLITSDLIDDLNRIYFSEQFVAENGIYVRPYNEQNATPWDKVTNLNTVAPGKTCFKFGYDSVRNLPFIEFPKDITELIGEGLSIKYIRTTGLQGNISAGFLTKLAKPGSISSASGVSVYPEGEENADGTPKVTLIISNMSATNTGKDPETIDEAYNSFKKTVGTFETLITCRDYANYIYNLQENGMNAVSNIQVTDRRTDYNYGNKILTFSEYGQLVKNEPDMSKITPFDLCLYPLKPVNSIYNAETYLNSFSPLYNTSYIQTVLEGEDSISTISHNYKSLDSEDVYAFKAMYKLNIKVATKYKVNQYEQKEIKTNIRNALYKNFNSRQLDYGYEIPYDTLVSVIENADERIKTIILDEPDITMKVMKTSGEESMLSDSSNTALVDYASKNILAGSVSLFEFDTDFGYRFNQKLTDESKEIEDKIRPYRYENIMSISTECTYDIDSATTTVTLRDNEVMLAVAPLMTTTAAYGAYTYFYFDSNSDIAANETYTLTGTDKLTVAIESSPYFKSIVYTNNSITTTTYLDGKIFGDVSTVNVTTPIRIKPSFNLKKDYTDSEGFDTQNRNNVLFESSKYPMGIKKLFGVANQEDGTFVETSKVYSLAVDETINKRDEVFIELKSASTPCYWIRNTEGNALFTADDYNETSGEFMVVLGEGESFIHADSSLNSAEVLGSGTKIAYKYTKTDDANFEAELNSWKIIDETVSISELDNLGLSAFSSYAWVYKTFTNNPLKLQRMQVLTLVKDDTMTFTPTTDATSLTLSNSWVSAKDYDLSYVINSTEVEEPSGVLEEGIDWLVRTRLDLNCDPVNGQKILDGQTITLKVNTNEYAPAGSAGTDVVLSSTEDDTYTTYFTVNTLLQMAGGDNINMSIFDSDRSTSTTKVFQFPFKAFHYMQAPIVINEVEYEYNSEGLLTLSVNRLGDSNKIELPLIAPKAVGSVKPTSMLMIYFNSVTADSPISVKFTNCLDFGRMSNFGGNFSVNTGTPVSLLKGLNVFYFNPNESDVTLEITSTDNFSELPAGLNLIIGTIDNPSNKTPMTVRNHSWTFSKQFDSSVFNETVMDNIIKKICASETDTTKFYWNAPLDELSIIESDDILSSEAFFDYNNIANRMTISQLIIPGETGNSESTIDIVRTSRA